MRKWWCVTLTLTSNFLIWINEYDFRHFERFDTFTLKLYIFDDFPETSLWKPFFCFSVALKESSESLKFHHNKRFVFEAKDFQWESLLPNVWHRINYIVFVHCPKKGNSTLQMLKSIPNNKRFWLEIIVLRVNWIFLITKTYLFTYFKKS